MVHEENFDRFIMLYYKWQSKICNTRNDILEKIKKHAERIIAHLCEVMVRRNVDRNRVPIVEINNIKNVISLSD
jgi:hypothetical protein